MNLEAVKQQLNPWHVTHNCNLNLKINFVFLRTQTKLLLSSHGDSEGEKCASRFQPRRTMSSIGLWADFVSVTLAYFDLPLWPLFRLFSVFRWVFFCCWTHCASVALLQPWWICDEAGNGDLISGPVVGETQGQDHFLPKCIIQWASRWYMRYRGPRWPSVSEHHYTMKKILPFQPCFVSSTAFLYSLLCAH